MSTHDFCVLNATIQREEMQWVNRSNVCAENERWKVDAVVPNVAPIPRRNVVVAADISCSEGPEIPI
ncbi:hypothetical protein V1477_018914 [Vespula maculifrons]|uniref:Uncharacterized protein n=1 Tax=Vespula maculifrons TaxID=7453 RepID=A0ABD2ATK9_VESMC